MGKTEDSPDKDTEDKVKDGLKEVDKIETDPDALAKIRNRTGGDKRNN